MPLPPQPSSSIPHAGLPPKVVERVRVLGHQLAAFAEALKTLRGWAEKGRLTNAELAAFPDFVLPESFAVDITVPETAPEQWTVESSVSQPWTSPRAFSVLHLPGLKRSWQGLLRGALLADLWRRLPHCWVVDHAALPPHAAIAGLGLARWSDFARLQGASERFQITLRDGERRLDSTCGKAEWEQAAAELVTSPPGTAMIELLGPAPAQRWQAAYGLTGGRWEILDLMRIKHS